MGGGVPGYSGSSEAHATSSIGVGGFYFNPKGSVLGSLPPAAWVGIAALAALAAYVLLRR